MVWEGLERLLFAQGLFLDVSWALVGMSWLSKISLGDFGAFGKHFGRIWRDFGSAFGIQALTFAWSWAWLFYVCSHLPPKNMLKD